MRFLLVTLLALAVFLQAEAAFKCPPKDGQYEDPVQCDKYYECEDGVATEKICPDGLVFDAGIRKINKCDQPFSVDCGDRLELQPPKSSKLCPRRNGYFAHPDERVCNIFYNCIEGESTEIVCPSGLHFDEYQGICVWPDAAGRQGCSEKSETLKDGFTCPKEPQLDHRGQVTVHPMFPHPEDCQKFYVCLNGVTPREQGCALGEAYNEESGKFEDPENVPGCEDWYKDDPRVEQTKKEDKLRSNAANSRLKNRGDDE